MVEDNDIKIFFSKNLSTRERACFESGIKLGALYHILCGIPIARNEQVVSSIEKGIQMAISCQPYVKSVNIDLDRDMILGSKTSEFDYDEITGKVIRARVEVEYESINVVAKVEWVHNLSYPLMYIEKIKEKQ